METDFEIVVDKIGGEIWELEKSVHYDNVVEGEIRHSCNGGHSLVVDSSILDDIEYHLKNISELLEGLSNKD